MKTLFIFLSALFCSHLASAQKDSSWSFDASANFYFFTDDFILLPVFAANKNHLHLEARYNYEDLETFSVWGGYNFYGGEKLEYFVTPMLGAVVGNSNGIAPGLEFDLTLGSFNLYSESEYLIEFSGTENHFFYMWTDISYAPTDWLWVGMSSQRTRLYQTEVEFQHGLLLGGGWKSMEATAYLYNFHIKEPFFMLSLAFGF